MRWLVAAGAAYAPRRRDPRDRDRQDRGRGARARPTAGWSSTSPPRAPASPSAADRHVEGEVEDAAAPAPEPPPRQRAPARPRRPGRRPPRPSDRRRATPVARRLARQAGVALDAIPGTRPPRAHRARDVERPAPSCRPGLPPAGGASPSTSSAPAGRDDRPAAPRLRRRPHAPGLPSRARPRARRRTASSLPTCRPTARPRPRPPTSEAVDAAMAAFAAGFAGPPAPRRPLVRRRGRHAPLADRLGDRGLPPDAGHARRLRARDSDALRRRHGRGPHPRRGRPPPPRCSGRRAARCPTPRSPRWPRESARGRLAGLAAALRRPRSASALDILRPLAALSRALPVRAIFGTEDRVIPATHALALPPRVAAHFLPTGHMPQWDAAADVADLLLGKPADGLTPRPPSPRPSAASATSPTPPPAR